MAFNSCRGRDANVLPLQPVVGLTHLGGAIPSSSTLTPLGVMLELVRRDATLCLAWSLAAIAEDATLCISCSRFVLTQTITPFQQEISMRLSAAHNSLEPEPHG